MSVSAVEDATSEHVAITEDEAALYDRQIRLWGLEAQNRMRNATILTVNLRGVATETIKNIVLAGIGKLILVDAEPVIEEDLGAGFFFREDDVGKARVDAARTHIQQLNPLVVVETISDIDTSSLDAMSGLLSRLLPSVDLVCLSDAKRDQISNINTICRAHNTLFYAGGSYGLMGYVFCDLLTHHYIAADRSQTTPQASERKMIKYSTNYVPFSDALKHTWAGLSKRQTKEVNPLNFFCILALWEYQARHGGQMPDTSFDQPESHRGMDSARSTPPPMPSTGVDMSIRSSSSPSNHSIHSYRSGSPVDELEAIANELITTSKVNPQVLKAMPRDVVEQLAQTAVHEFSPVCAVIGGMLAQDLLKALAGRESPYANLLVFDGVTGNGNVVRMGM